MIVVTIVQKITISGGQKQRLLILDKVTGGYKMVSEEPGK